MIGKFVNVHMDHVIISSPSFTQHIEHLKGVFRLLHEAGLTLNKDKSSLPIKVITDHAALTRLTHGKKLSNRIIRWALKLAEFNIEWEYRSGTQNEVSDVLSRNPVESIKEEKVNCALIRDMVLSSREQLIEKQRKDPELGHIYKYLENPEDSSVNATTCENGPVVLD
ncbi:retrovirus-related Pol polyprotein from transposon 297 [Trichonephila clavipes]|nr:retrovirus-related Pol polyprotein from transposon 297 [Trichonephila clavipes]